MIYINYKQAPPLANLPQLLQLKEHRQIIQMAEATENSKQNMFFFFLQESPMSVQIKYNFAIMLYLLREPREKETDKSDIKHVVYLHLCTMTYFIYLYSLRHLNGCTLSECITITGWI